MRPAWIVVAGILLALAGGIWILQGLNVIVSDSFMTGDRTWVVIGAATVVGGLALSWWGWSRRGRSGPGAGSGSGAKPGSDPRP